MRWLGIDSWSGTHLFGSCCLAMVLGKLMPPFAGAFLAFLAGVLWETVDCQVAAHYDWFVRRKLSVDRLFDHRGGDWCDLLLDAAGALGAYLLMAI